MLHKFINQPQPLHSYTKGEPSSSFKTTNAVRQNCPISPVFPKFVIDGIMENASGDLQHANVQMARRKKLYGLDYADILARFFESVDYRHRALDTLTKAVTQFGLLCITKRQRILTRPDINSSETDTRWRRTNHRKSIHFPKQLHDCGRKHNNRSERVHIQGSSGVRRTEAVLAPASYFTKVERSSVLYNNALSSTLWLRDMECAC